MEVGGGRGGGIGRGGARQQQRLNHGEKREIVHSGEEKNHCVTAGEKYCCLA